MAARQILERKTGVAKNLAILRRNGGGKALPVIVAKIEKGAPVMHAHIHDLAFHQLKTSRKIAGQAERQRRGLFHRILRQGPQAP